MNLKLKAHYPYLLFILLAIFISALFTYAVVPALNPTLNQIKQYSGKSDNLQQTYKLFKDYARKHPKDIEGLNLYYLSQATYFNNNLDNEVYEDEDSSLAAVNRAQVLQEYWKERKKHSKFLKSFKKNPTDIITAENIALFNYHQILLDFYGPSEFDSEENKVKELNAVLSIPGARNIPYINIMRGVLAPYNIDSELFLINDKINELNDDIEAASEDESNEFTSGDSAVMSAQLQKLLEQRKVQLFQFEKDALHEIQMEGDLKAAYYVLRTIYSAWDDVFPGKLESLIFSGDFIKNLDLTIDDPTEYYQFSETEYFYFTIKYIFIKSAFYFLIAFAGIITWILFFYFTDLFEREKPWTILLAFLFGIASGCIALYTDMRGYGLIYIESDSTPIDFANKMSYFMTNAGMVEEGAKFGCFLLFYLLFRKRLNESFDFIVYPAFIALGFAFLENLIYINQGDYDIVQLIFLRTLTALSHCNFAIVWGIAFYTALQQKGLIQKGLILLGGYLIASLYHAFHNTSFSYEFLQYANPVIEFLFLQAGIHYMLSRSVFFMDKELSIEKEFRLYKIWLLTFSFLVMLYWLYSNTLSLKFNPSKLLLVLPFLMIITSAYYYPNILRLKEMRKNNDNQV